MMHPPPRNFRIVPFPPPSASVDGPSAVLRGAQWIGSSVFILALHLGFFLALTETYAVPAPDQPEEAPAALMITLAPISVSAKSTLDNAAPGPDAAASEAVPDQPLEAVEPPPPPPLPVTVPAMPAPPEVKSEAVLPPTPPEPEQREERPPEPEPVARPVPVKVEEPREVKPKQEPPKVKPKRDVKKPKKKPMAAAAKPSGGPKSEVETGKVSAAAATGAAAAPGVARAGWLADVRMRIVRAKRFPAEARSRGEVGAALVAVSFGADGSVTAARLSQSSGSASLDQEAVAVMHRAGPFSPPPENRATTIAIPISFNRR